MGLVLRKRDLLHVNVKKAEQSVHQHVLSAPLSFCRVKLISEKKIM